MKIERIGEPEVIMSNPNSRHNYFAWPTSVRLQNGKIAVVASGYRLRHICPFGKMVISYSEDDAKTYTAPAPVIDTALDDRDGGIMTFGESGVIVTSFNNKLEFQRMFKDAYTNAYLDMITPEEEAEYLGSTFKISHDCGVTFGKLHKSPVTSPHGPVELKDGTVLWVGRTFCFSEKRMDAGDCIQAHKINPDGTMEYVGQIENIDTGGLALTSCEPHAIVLDDGKIIVHIRVQDYGADPWFTIFQSESEDNGKTWTKPRQILSQNGGSPPHLFMHSSNTLICTYGYRQEPYCIRAMLSKDNGKTWETDFDLCTDCVNVDIGYPSTVELSDGSLVTAYYAHKDEESPAVIWQQKWRIAD